MGRSVRLIAKGAMLRLGMVFTTLLFMILIFPLVACRALVWGKVPPRLIARDSGMVLLEASKLVLFALVNYRDGLRKSGNKAADAIDRLTSKRP